MLVRGISIEVSCGKSRVLVEDAEVVAENETRYKISKTLETFEGLTIVDKDCFNTIILGDTSLDSIYAKKYVIIEGVDEGPQKHIEALKRKLTEIVSKRLEVVNKIARNLSEV